MPSFGRSKTTQAARKAERFRTDGFSCPMGDVVDLSSSGMRVRSEQKPLLKKGDAHQFHVRTCGKQFVVNGRVAWVRRKGLLSGPYELGIEFVGVTADAARAIAKLAKFGYVAPGADSQPKKRDAAPGEGSSPGGASAHETKGRSDTIQASVQMIDLYAVLEVEPEADIEEIKASYRRLARERHPDVCTSADATEAFALLHKAYAVLRDPEMRQRYDDAVARARRAA
jgi:hypothetical protein